MCIRDRSWVTTRMAAGDGRIVMAGAGWNWPDLIAANSEGIRPPRPGVALELPSSTVDLALSGQLAVLAVGPDIEGHGRPGLVLADVVDPNAPREVGTAWLDNAPVGVATVGRTAYVATEFTVQAFDLTVPTVPDPVWSVREPGPGPSYEERLVAADSSHLAVVRTDGVRLFDLSNPQRPREGLW